MATAQFSLSLGAGALDFEAEVAPERWNGFPVPLVAHDFAVQIAEAVDDPAPEFYDGLQPYDGLQWDAVPTCSDRLSCGCCRGPVEDRCCCWNHQDTPRGIPPKVCSRHTKPLTADQRDGGARFEAVQNAGLDY